MRRLEVFGSATRADFDEARSDVDFLVDLGTDDPKVDPLEAYFGLKDALESLLGRPVDLVSRGAIRNPAINAAVERERELVYAE